MNDLDAELDEHDRPLIEIKTDFLKIYQITGTNSLKVDLTLPDFEVIGGKKTIGIVFDLETIQKISKVFEDYGDIRAYCDGSSLRNPGSVSCEILNDFIVRVLGGPYGGPEES